MKRSSPQMKLLFVVLALAALGICFSKRRDLPRTLDSYEMDFSKWDGKGDMCFEADDENNGFDDEECTKEPNEKKKPAKSGAAVNYFHRNQPIARLLWY